MLYYFEFMVPGRCVYVENKCLDALAIMKHLFINTVIKHILYKSLYQPLLQLIITFSTKHSNMAVKSYK